MEGATSLRRSGLWPYVRLLEGRGRKKPCYKFGYDLVLPIDSQIKERVWTDIMRLLEITWCQARESRKRRKTEIIRRLEVTLNQTRPAEKEK